MATIYFNIENFRLQFPAFSNAAVFPNVMLQMYFDMATSYISNKDWGAYYGGLNLIQRTLSLSLMTAHLTAISQQTKAGQQGGVLASATNDKVTVAMQQPTLLSQWQYWLQGTPYGQQLLVLLQNASVGGYYIGGSGVLDSFR